MIPNAKELDLHKNDMGILCTVSETGQLIPYSPYANTIVSEPEPTAIVLDNVEILAPESITEPETILADLPTPLHPSKEEIAAMTWKQVKSYCLENGLSEKPDGMPWGDYLTQQLYPEDSADA